MLKFLIFFILLASSSLFLVDAFSLEVEIQKESERVIESMGWLEPEKVSYQEQIQITIDHADSKNKIAVTMLSQDPNDIRFPDYIEKISSEPQIISMMITNQFACAPGKIESACVIIDLKREGLGDSIDEIRENTRKITDKIVGSGVIIYAAEFDSITVKKKNNYNGENVSISRALYTINKQSTETMFKALSNMLLSTEIRTSGGFYDHATQLSKNRFSSFHISLIPFDDSVLRSMQISLVCSDIIPELVRCPENITGQISSGKISPLDFLQTETINRSNMFTNEFLPLNSIIHVIIFSEEDLEVKEINTNLIEKLQNIGDLQKNGWHFSESATRIDARYIFGHEYTVNKNDLVFSIGTNTDSTINGNEIKNGGGCLIATAAFGSEMAPQIQFLREIRDNTVLQTESGSAFIIGFNQFYYSFSPAVADYERENVIFKETVKITLTPLLTSLTLLQYADIDSESEMLGYGIGVILLNIGMYFVAPAVLIMKIKKLV